MQPLARHDYENQNSSVVVYWLSSCNWLVEQDRGSGVPGLTTTI